MAYQHKLVSNITETASQQLGEDTTQDGDLHHSQELKNFRRRLRKEMRGVYTKTRNQSSAWVCMKGEPMALGWIGYGDFQTAVAAREFKYVVYARDIENRKYNDHNAQFNMRMAINIDTATKHAKTFLRKYTTGEISTVLARNVRTLVKEVSTKVIEEFNAAKHAVGFASLKSDLITELTSMVQAGHTFTNANLDANFRDFLAKKKENDRFVGRVVPVDFFRAYEHYDGMRADTVRIADITSYQMEPMYEHRHTYLANELPDDLAGKIAVMSMCADGHFVEGVGYRVNEAMFYLYVEDVTT